MNAIDIPPALIVNLVMLILGAGAAYGLMKAKQEGFGRELKEMKAASASRASKAEVDIVRMAVDKLEKRVDCIDSEGHLLPAACEKNQARCQATILVTMKNIEEMVRELKATQDRTNEAIMNFTGRLARVETSIAGMEHRIDGLEREVRKGSNHAAV